MSPRRKRQRPDTVAAYEARMRVMTAPSAEAMTAQIFADLTGGLTGPALEEAERHARSVIDPYTVTLERLRIAQGDGCAVCLNQRRLVVDHDHESGLVRGWLCRSCNIIEGKGGSELFDAYRQTPPSSVLGIVERYRHPFGPSYEKGPEWTANDTDALLPREMAGGGT